MKDSRILMEWLDANGNQIKLNNGSASTPVNDLFKDRFIKLVKHMEDCHSWSLVNYMSEWELDIDFDLVTGRHNLSIDVGSAYIHVKAVHIKTGNVLLDYTAKHDEWSDILEVLKNSHIIENKRLCEWVDNKGNKVNTKLPASTISSSNNKSTIDDFTTVFYKLRDHIDSVWGDVHTIMCTKYELDIYFGNHTNRQNLNIEFVPSKNYFEIYLTNSYGDIEIFKGKRSDWNSVLSGLKLLGVIKNKSLCEWVDNKGNKITAAGNINNSQPEEVVYIWDMYVDPRDKGTWCSAEKYNGEYDGYVYRSKEKAYAGGFNHLLELNDEGQLRGDPDDYDVDAVAIPKSEVSDYTLRFSGL